MNDNEFRLKLSAAHAARDDGAWALCEFCLEAREAHYPEWDAKIAAFERRAPRTVRDWARAAIIRRDIKQIGDLTYPFYLVASRSSLPLEQVVELMRVFAAEPGATLESFAAQLHDMAGGGAGEDFYLLPLHIH